jgi:hypothetical protein
MKKDNLIKVLGFTHLIDKNVENKILNRIQTLYPNTYVVLTVVASVYIGKDTE